jgi:serine/threonine-protein kinase RsbW
VHHGTAGKLREHSLGTCLSRRCLKEKTMIRMKNIERVTNISNPALFVELRDSFASRASAISPFVDRLMTFIRLLMGKSATANEAEDDIETAIHEALSNAVVHGNHEDPKRQVHVTCRCTLDGEVLITVQDEGEGFNGEVPDPRSPERRLLTHGRGLLIMRTLMDEVSFENNGTVVRLRKRVNNQSA